MRVALVHDWAVSMRGGERVLEQMAVLFPDAEIFTLVCKRAALSTTLRERTIHTSALQWLPGSTRHYPYALPIMPALIEQFDLRGFDLVISSSSCVAKGVRVPRGVPHLCYCHTPMRYLYDQSGAYAQRFSGGVRAVFDVLQPRLRRWDRANANGVTRFVANSEHVRSRIRAWYRRESTVIHPPVDVDRFISTGQQGDYYVTVSALVPYKRVDLIVDAFNRLGRRLIIVGSGSECRSLERAARSNIEFTGWTSDAEIERLLCQARGFVFAGTEDFGIALVEAQAAGVPVIAYAAGGALETVQHGETGILFREQTADAIAQAVLAAEQHTWAPANLRAHVQRFRPERFRAQLLEEIEYLLAARDSRAIIGPSCV
jgi:glycosyltransferase involved in cell wall biosynthesis